MPGSSLWLVPAPGSRISKALTTLIHQTVPSHFPSIKAPVFAPHITITSGLPDDIPDAQKWLDSLTIPDEVAALFETLDVGDVFFKKMTIRVQKASTGLVDLAVECRAKGVEDGAVEKAREWAREEYGPHCSLLYADIEVPEEKRAAVEKDLEEAGISLDGEGEMGGWNGGEVWLVATYKEIKDWEPVAKRQLPA